MQSLVPSFSSFLVEEPQLVFGGNNLSVDPKTGLGMFGPIGNDANRNKTIRIGVVGTGESIGEFLDFLNKAQRPILAGFKTPGPSGKARPLDPHTYPDFPGCSKESAFRCSFVSDKTIFHRSISQDHFASALKSGTEEACIKAVVALLERELVALEDLEEQPDVIAVVLPSDVEHKLAHVGHAMAKRRKRLSPRELLMRSFMKDEKKGQATLDLDFGSEDERCITGYWNIHHAFKARAMRVSIPTQWIWESTLRTPHLSNVAWNLFTALYYKSGSNPWGLSSLPDNTCFIGISFYKDRPTGPSDYHTSIAQIFGAGEGIVIKGDRAVIDKSRGDSSPHLLKDGALSLMQRAIETYTIQHNGPPTRVVVHKSSRYWPEELEGLKEGLGTIGRHDFLSISDPETRFLRLGSKPVIRGTAIKLASRHYLLFTNGYIPFLRIYPSKRIPCPLEITEHHGDSTAKQVCEEIMALTKLNWNSCSFGSHYPITLRFARDVGRVIAELPSDGSVTYKSKYKYYM